MYFTGSGLLGLFNAPEFHFQTVSNRVLNLGLIRNNYVAFIQSTPSPCCFLYSIGEKITIMADQLLDQVRDLVEGQIVSIPPERLA